MQSDNELYTMSDLAIISRIGQKIREIRLSKNITQNRLQQLSGVYRTTIGDVENGKNVSLLVLVQLLRALDRLDLLSEFFEVQQVSPILYAKMHTVQRLRASEPRVKYKTKSEW
jgi:transcriptional regulator with XRE-family HTH domain